MAAAQADRADDTLDQLLFKLGDFFYLFAARTMLFSFAPKLG